MIMTKHEVFKVLYFIFDKVKTVRTVYQRVWTQVLSLGVPHLGMKHRLRMIDLYIHGLKVIIDGTSITCSIRAFIADTGSPNMTIG